MSAIKYSHTPVLLDEVISVLNLRPNYNVVDGTLGGGGHSEAILKRIAPHGKVLAFDRDARAIRSARAYLKKYRDRLDTVHGSYTTMQVEAQQRKLTPVQAVLLDLGFSSDQLNDIKRGFSFTKSAPLDLRYDTRTGATAADLLARLSQEELEALFREYGEEPKARNLAKAIVATRKEHPLVTTTDLLAIVAEVKGYSNRSIHPATLVWQALRIAVNQEYQELTQALEVATSLLAPGGVLAVISFHSGEDRLVKDFMRRESRDCLCPPEFPVCRCHHLARLKLITSHPVTASAKEISLNSRSRSAKLRAATKLS